MAVIISLESLYSSTVSNLTRDPCRWMSFLGYGSAVVQVQFPGRGADLRTAPERHGLRGPGIMEPAWAENKNIKKTGLITSTFY